MPPPIAEEEYRQRMAEHMVAARASMVRMEASIAGRFLRAEGGRS